jgi:tyrosyl-tRNA synthetase
MNAQNALEASRALFVSGSANENMPSTAISKADFEGGIINILTLLAKSKLAPSRGEARRLVEQGGISVNDEKIETISKDFAPSDFEAAFVIKKGKKIFHRITLE